MTLDKQTLLEAAKRRAGENRDSPDPYDREIAAICEVAIRALAEQQPESRDEVLEEAAKVCESDNEGFSDAFKNGCRNCAAAVCRLKNAGGHGKAYAAGTSSPELAPIVPPAPDAAPQAQVNADERGKVELSYDEKPSAQATGETQQVGYKPAAAAPSSTADNTISYSPHRIHSTSVAPSAASPNHPYLQECLDAIDKHNASAPKGSDPTIRALIDAILRWQGIMRDDHTLCKAANAALPALQRLAERKQP